MPQMHDTAFYQHRATGFDKVIALIEARAKAALPSILPRADDISPGTLRAGAEKEVWSLFLSGIRHLKDGAPDNQPGSMAEALTRISLRSSPLAAALGVKPPHFEPIYFSVDYTTGHEAALFACQRLIEAAEGDLSKSRTVIQQKILAEKPAGGEVLKKQMAASFDMLVEIYGQSCQDLKSALDKVE